MKKILFTVLILLSFCTISFCQNQKELKNQMVSDIVGEWINIDSKTGNVTKVIITNDVNGLSIEAFGKCHPTDCEWGKVKLHLIAANAFDNLIPFDYLFAIWEIDGKKPNAMTEIFKITVEMGQVPKLLVENIALFNDDSGRNDCHTSEIMIKKL